MSRSRFFSAAFVIATLVVGCAELDDPTIAPLPTLTPSAVGQQVVEVANTSTATPDRPTITPTITLTPIVTQTPLFAAIPTLSSQQLTAGLAPTTNSNLPTPTIAYFVSFPTEAAPGDSVLLFWSTTGGVSGAVTLLNDDGKPAKSWAVAVEGSLNVTLVGRSDTEVYVLSVTNGIATVNKQLAIKVVCSGSWFFVPAPENRCPDAPPTVMTSSVFEFERGRMFWLSATNEILVLFADGKKPAWVRLPNPYSAGMPEDDPSIQPPEGLSQPKRGFGMIWRTTPGLADRIGWAIGDENSFIMTLQGERGDPKLARLYFSDPANSAIALDPDGKSWQVVGTTSSSP